MLKTYKNIKNMFKKKLELKKVKDSTIFTDPNLHIKIMDNLLITTQQLPLTILELNIKNLSHYICIMEHQSMIIKSLKFQHIKNIFQDIILQHIKDQ